MEKSWFQSKTVWGAGLFAIAAFLTQSGLVDSELVLPLIQWVGGFLGIAGIRDKLGDL